VAEQVQINVAIDGDNAQLIALSFEHATEDVAAHVDFQDSGAAQVGEFDLVANEPQVYDVGNGNVTNPLTGNPVTVAYASQANTAAAGTLKIVSLEDTTP
jgi:hypothetical protein